MTNHPAKLIRARSRLVITQPFWGTLALGLRLERDDSPDNPTMATDGRALFYNSGFVASLPDDELLGVVAHEVGHPSLGHHTRRAGRDAREWNIACDLALNPILLTSGFKLPKGALVDSQYAGMNAEQIFAERQRQRQAQPKPQAGQGGQQSQAGQPGQAGQSGAPGQGGQQPGQGAPAGPGASGAPSPATGQGNAPAGPGNATAGAAGKPSSGQAAGAGAPSGSDPGGCGAIRDAAPDAAGNEAAEREWSARVRQAVAVAKAHNKGKVPAGLADLVRTVNAPAIDWRAILRRFIDDSASKDYAWTRPSRRHLAAGRILPGFIPDRPSHIVAMVDISGSIGADEMRAYVAELQGMLDEGAADRVTVAYADTEVQDSESFDAGDVIEVRDRNGGGTCFRQPMAWISENHPDASAVVYLTDMVTDDHGDEPDAPVLWIVSGPPDKAAVWAGRAPFGEPVILNG